MKEWPHNCLYCVKLGSDDDGSDYPAYTFPVCNDIRNAGRDNLKSFPFKKDQKCHVPGFWLVMEIDEEMKEIFDEEMKNNEGLEFPKALKYFEDNYFNTSKRGGEWHR